MEDRLSAALFAVLCLAVLTAWIDLPWAAFPIYALLFATGLAGCLGCLWRPRHLYLHPWGRCLWLPPGWVSGKSGRL